MISYLKLNLKVSCEGLVGEVRLSRVVVGSGASGASETKEDEEEHCFKGCVGGCLDGFGCLSQVFVCELGLCPEPRYADMTTVCGLKNVHFRLNPSHHP